MYVLTDYSDLFTTKKQRDQSRNSIRFILIEHFDTDLYELQSVRTQFAQTVTTAYSTLNHHRPYYVRQCAPKFFVMLVKAELKVLCVSMHVTQTTTTSLNCNRLSC
jgi:hypothetical protein